VEQIDAVIACGEGAIRRAVGYVQRAEIPDAEWAFAVMLVLGCIASEETLPAAIDLLQFLCERDLQEGRAAAEALAHAPHPGVAHAVTPLLAKENPELRRAAATILLFRGELTNGQTRELLRDPDPDLVSIALEEGVESGALSGNEDWTLLLMHDSETVVRAAMRLAFTRGHTQGRRRALELLSDGRADFADAVLWFGLAGERGDWPILEKALAANANPLVVEAIGYWGYCEAVPVLLDRLKNVSDEGCIATSLALERIIGAGLSKWDRESQEFRLAEAEQYERWWQEASPFFTSGVRFRRGRRFGAAALLGELGHNTHCREQRTIAHLELVSLGGTTAPRFRSGDFIRRQEERILEWKRILGMERAASDA
jgi:hypothetical protein